MANSEASTIIASVGVATVFYKDIKSGTSPFMNLFFAGALIVILAGLSSFSPDLANALAVLYLISCLLVRK